MTQAHEVFSKAIPVWISGREWEANLSAGFAFDFLMQPGCETILRVTGSTLYRVFMNGRLIHYGPARAAHGFFRVDEVKLEGPPGKTRLTIEVAGYNCASYYTLNHKSFLCAEILCNGIVVAYTGHTVSARVTDERSGTSMRYSFQRAFTEIWRLNNAQDTVYDAGVDAVDVDWMFIPRGLPYPAFDRRISARPINCGYFVRDTGAPMKNFWYMKENGPPDAPFYELQQLRFAKTLDVPSAGDLSIEAGEYAVFKLPKNNNGFIASQIVAKTDSTLWFVFDEMMEDDIVNGLRMTCVNIVQYDLKASNSPYQTLSFESYGFQYIMCVVKSGGIAVNSLGLVEYGYPLCGNTVFECGDTDLEAIFRAAVETYRQNTMDVFMDCPTRERAGWLCDSYFTAQSAQFFSGCAHVERAFMENYTLPQRFPGIPQGMLPMCYPAEHPNGNFIPQWALWYIIELYDYFKRDSSDKPEKFRKVCYDLLGWMKRYLNADGLLEGLPGWNFIEWSKANEFVQDVSYPTNMLYKRALEYVGMIYRDDALIRQAEEIRGIIIDQSFNGHFFVDNALRDERGILNGTQNITEVCQYYAFFFEVAKDEDRFAALRDTVIHKLGPFRTLPGIAPANAFIGYYLRLSLLLKWRKYSQAIDECKLYFLKMAKATGTLWELDSAKASLNHGFASFAGVVLVKCITGVADINERERIITIDKEHCSSAAVSVRIGCGGRMLEIHRDTAHGTTTYEFPEGYSIQYL